MGRAKSTSDVFLGDGTLRPEATALIAIEPKASGAVNPNPLAAPFHQSLHHVRSTESIEGPCIKKVSDPALIQRLIRVNGQDQEIDSVRCMRHTVVYPGPRA